MGSFRFFRRFSILPGLKLNMSKSGLSTTLGDGGAQITAGPRGVRRTFGLPGTGLYYTSTGSSGARSGVAAEEPGAYVPSISGLRRLFTSRDHLAFVDAIGLLVSGAPEEAAEVASQGGHPDCQILAAVLGHSLPAYRAARERAIELGDLFHRYDVVDNVNVPITEYLSVELPVGSDACMLGIAYLADCEETARKLCSVEPDALAPRIALARILIKDMSGIARINEIIELTHGVEVTDGPMEAQAVLYRAMALRALGQPEVAMTTVAPVCSKNKKRPHEMMRRAREVRAMCRMDTAHSTLLSDARRKSIAKQALRELRELLSNGHSTGRLGIYISTMEKKLRKMGLLVA